MNGAFDRPAAEAIILEHFHSPDDRHQSWWINPSEMAAALAACVTPDRRIAAISALCKQGEAYGYVRIDAIRDVLRGGS